MRDAVPSDTFLALLEDCGKKSLDASDAFLALLEDSREERFGCFTRGT